MRSLFEVHKVIQYYCLVYKPDGKISLDELPPPENDVMKLILNEQEAHLNEYKEKKTRLEKLLRSKPDSKAVKVLQEDLSRFIPKKEVTVLDAIEQANNR